ncbi:hypothetical protein G7072_04295 [Nocardioides sp. HDW12B]|uniref:hypothetical protein n=1 Tax=Nocardioides sp. HDW12B TaxID=2714939 RepID=UPI00140C5523|nr:hypothetical protein [Nocardioides sp. HDW12B]QIK65662.1 hypothetical protein G7072_04295 [Nocardioides sp. HDW12B]
MDEVEARAVLDRRVMQLRDQSYEELRDTWLLRPDCEDVTGASGIWYQVEIEALWDDKKARTLRMFVAIDDGRGWRAFAPLTTTFVVAPDGTFLGE